MSPCDGKEQERLALPQGSVFIPKLFHLRGQNALLLSSCKILNVLYYIRIPLLYGICLSSRVVDNSNNIIIIIIIITLKQHFPTLYISIMSQRKQLGKHFRKCLFRIQHDSA